MEQNNKRLDDLRQEYFQMNIPQDGIRKMQESIDRAKQEKRRRRRQKISVITAMAASVALLCVLPNTNASIAHAMEQIPVLGSFFRVITIRNYEYSDATHDAKVDVGQVRYEGGDSEVVVQINLEMQEIAEELIAEFEEGLKGQGYKGLYSSYEVVTDNENYFSICMIVEETQASSYQYQQYFTIDKQSGLRIALQDLFVEGSDYLMIISEDIREQMREQMAENDGVIYFVDNQDFPENDFQGITDETNFYINEEGRLVIAFDEYEVAPGYMGTPEFVITEQALENIWKSK